VLKRATLEWRVRPLAEWSSDYCPMIDDARTALDWAFCVGGDLAMGAELTVALAPIWIQLSLMQEWAKRAEQALQVVISTPQREARQEMQLSAALGAALLHTRGCEPDGDAAWSKALAIADRLDDREYQLSALFGLYKRKLITAECRAALSLAQEFCSLAATRDDPPAVNWGHLMMSRLLHVMGDQSTARRHLDSIVDCETARRLRFPLLEHDFEARPIILGPVLWFQGFADQAARLAAKTVDDAIDAGLSQRLDHLFASRLRQFAGKEPAVPDDDAHRHSLARHKLLSPAQFLFWCRIWYGVVLAGARRCILPRIEPADQRHQSAPPDAGVQLEEHHLRLRRRWMRIFVQPG